MGIFSYFKGACSKTLPPDRISIQGSPQKKVHSPMPLKHISQQPLHRYFRGMHNTSKSIVLYQKKLWIHLAALIAKLRLFPSFETLPQTNYFSINDVHGFQEPKKGGKISRGAKYPREQNISGDSSMPINCDTAMQDMGLWFFNSFLLSITSYTGLFS